MDLEFDFLMGRNNVLILQFVTSWVSELAQLSIYADIFRRLGSGTNFRQSSIFSNLQQYSFSNFPSKEKYTDFGLTLQPTTARYTSTFSTIWVSIDFYFFRRIQKKQNLVFPRRLNYVFLTIWITLRGGFGCIFPITSL